jgi:hypothetical protein
MIRTQIATISLLTGVSAVMSAPAARADDNVTYEIVSDSIATANVEYSDGSERKALEHVTLPWRTNATVADAQSPSADGAQVRADWRPAARPSGWVTVRIYFRGKVLCESTLDVGDATCYGSTPGPR